MGDDLGMRYTVMFTTSEDGHPELGWGEFDAGIVDECTGGVILYGHFENCVRIATVLNQGGNNVHE